MGCCERIKIEISKVSGKKKKMINRVKCIYGVFELKEVLLYYF